MRWKIVIQEIKTLDEKYSYIKNRALDKNNLYFFKKKKEKGMQKLMKIIMSPGYAAKQLITITQCHSDILSNTKWQIEPKLGRKRSIQSLNNVEGSSNHHIALTNLFAKIITDYLNLKLSRLWVI